MSKIKSATTFHYYDTSIGVWAENVGEDWETYERIRQLLKRNGFSFHQDVITKKHYPSLAKSHHEGRRGDLQFKTQYHGRHIEITFFQELNTENKHGGFYDFSRLGKMPYLMRLSFFAIRAKLEKLFIELGLVNSNAPQPKNAFESVALKRAEMARFHGANYYADAADRRPSYNGTDKDGITLQDGMVRYFRDRRGYLQRGVIQYNLNSMWWVIVNKDYFENISAGRLFTYDPSRHARKQHPEAANRLKASLAKAVEAQNFERAIPMRDALKSLEAA